jgi:hypothetical protein
MGWVCVVAWPSVAHGQARGTTSVGMFGPQTVGSPTGASPSSSGGITSGMGSNNPTGIGGGGNNSGAATTGTSLGSGLVGGMQTLQAGGATGFVGAQSATVNNPLSRVGAQGGQVGRPQSFNQLSQFAQASRQNQFNQQQAQRASRTTNQAQSQFRVPLRLGFQQSAIVAARINNDFANRLMRMPGLAKVGPIEARLQGRTAVLQGVVKTEADRQLAEALARLEPEVQAVDNRLLVGSPEPVAPGPASAQ